MTNQWISGILGIIVAGVIFLDLSQTVLTWTLVVLGLAIAINSFWNVAREPNEGGVRSRGLGM